MITAIVIASLSGLLVGGGGVLLLKGDGNKAGKHDAEIAQAQAAAVEAAGRAGADAAREVLAPELARVDALEALAARLPAYCVGGPLYSESACMAWGVCTRAGLAEGASVEAVGCDRALNAWESERQIAVIEAGEADTGRREERRRVYERRK